MPEGDVFDKPFGDYGSALDYTDFFIHIIWFGHGQGNAADYIAQRLLRGKGGDSKNQGAALQQGLADIPSDFKLLRQAVESDNVNDYSDRVF